MTTAQLIAALDARRKAIFDLWMSNSTNPAACTALRAAYSVAVHRWARASVWLR